MTNQFLIEFPNAASFKILYISILILSFVVSCAYSSSLISFLAVSHLPFNTLEEFVKDGTYGLIAVDNGIHYNMIKVIDISSLPPTSHHH